MTASVATTSPAAPVAGEWPFALSRNAAGRLVLTDAQGRVTVGVVPVRAFPISAADEGVSLVDGDGHERAWIERLDQLAPAERALLLEALQEREFMPEIQRLLSVSGFATPSTWRVDTDRGPFTLVLKGEEEIRRLGGGLLLIADSHGVQFLIRDLFALDRQSRKWLDRFL